MVDTPNPILEKHRLIASDRVEGTRVYNPAGDRLGSIRNFMVDKASGRVEYVVIQFGGILGMGNEFYPIPWDMLTYDVERGGYIVTLTRQQLEHAPRHDADFPEYDHNYGQRVFDYYGMAYPYPYI
jgi:hypothetical protein